MADSDGWLGWRTWVADDCDCGLLVRGGRRRARANASLRRALYIDSYRRSAPADACKKLGSDPDMLWGLVWTAGWADRPDQRGRCRETRAARMAALRAAAV